MIVKLSKKHVEKTIEPRFVILETNVFECFVFAINIYIETFEIIRSIIVISNEFLQFHFGTCKPATAAAPFDDG